MSYQPLEGAGERLHLSPTGRNPTGPERRLPQQAEPSPAPPLGANPRSVHAIEGHYINTQQGLERGYWLRRQTQSRARLLAHVAHDAVLLLDAQTLCVLDANPAAIALFADPRQALIGEPLRPCIAEALRPALDDLLHGAVANGQAAEVRLALTTAHGAIELSASPAWADRQRCLVLRCRRSSADPAALAKPAPDDAVVITDTLGRVLEVNAALLALCSAADAAAVQGRPIAEVLGGPAAQWPALLKRLAERRVIGRFELRLGNTVGTARAGSTARTDGPGVTERPALLSAAVLSEADSEQFGFALHSPVPAGPALPAAQHA